MPKWAKGHPPKPSRGHSRINEERYNKLGHLFNQKPVTIKFNNSSNKLLRTNMISIPKRCRNGTKLDVQTHQKSMPKQVTNNMVQIIKNHVFWYVKTLEFIVKTMIYEDFAGCVRKWNNYQKPPKHIPKSISKSIQNQCNIHARSNY